jgi:hypothetical protein
MTGCGTSEVSFQCNPSGTDVCPADRACPEVSLGADGCEDLPSLFGHPSIPVDVGRPVGCIARLPYGNPYFGNAQQTCDCQRVPFANGADADELEKPHWECPI